MSIVPVSEVLPAKAEKSANNDDLDDDPKPVRKKGKRRSTSHLKAVPESLEQRETFKRAAEEFAKGLDKSRAFNKNELEAHSRKLLDQMALPEKFLGFAMVMIGNFFWKQQFMAIPFNRRMLLLPHCLKHAEGCPAEYSEFGLDCERCGACSIADYKVRAEQLGYKVVVAEGSPVVLILGFKGVDWSAGSVKQLVDINPTVQHEAESLCLGDVQASLFLLYRLLVEVN